MTEKEFVDAVSLSGALRQQAADLVGKWTAGGLPGRDGLEAAATVLKEASLGGGLWSPPPVMLTATVDDGIGQGIELIGRFADALGVRVEFMGLMRRPEQVVETARRLQPDLVGLTLLQLDSEPAVAEIARGLPERTVLVGAEIG